VFYSQIDATALGTPGLRSTTGVVAQAKLDYRPPADDSAQIYLTHTDKRLTPQGSVSAVTIVNLGFKHILLPGLSAVMTVTDLFNGQRNRRYVSTPTLTQVYERSVAGQVVWFGLTYAIGGKNENGSKFDYDSSGLGH
jgi:hypothetical protein